ncbi:ABC transporter ATP-binding protein [Pseudoduganella violacea]|uniref:Multiple sugar transport system ATP-binding protein n=1 Tax=Pseudoduganella violacea TaxID=1715466 RepID=A0A7W5FUB4_9BURK|nr:sn-glycerol-3-phosphate ABC transporter ATP-binding protein UgpC [Pseudoduganella violacea]MBB3119572.1 multiple sugar transport system ATP-binding protein [Pseudoduganella violacea]
MAAISLRGLRKSYDGGPEVVKGLDLEIADGEFMVFVGPSGCGKSTLLRMIAGLEEISAGELLIGGALANRLAPAERGVAMVFQSYALYPHMTVRENMGFALKMARVPERDIRIAVDRVADILQIARHLESKPRALSGGERQRVAIGRAIVRQPKVFLFDEPLSNLDASLRVQTRIELARLHKELGTTMVYVTHDQVEAMTLGDRVAVFNGGYMEQVGAPLALYSRPRTRFVAGFIGALRMNFLPLREISEGAAVVSERCRIPLPPAAGAPGGAVLGVRPEHLNIVAPEQGCPARVNLIEQLGDAQIVHATLCDSPHTVAIKLHGGQRLPLEPEQLIGFVPEPDRVFLFDRAGRVLAPH